MARAEVSIEIGSGLKEPVLSTNLGYARSFTARARRDRAAIPLVVIQHVRSCDRRGPALRLVEGPNDLSRAVNVGLRISQQTHAVVWRERVVAEAWRPAGKPTIS